MNKKLLYLASVVLFGLVILIATQKPEPLNAADFACGANNSCPSGERCYNGDSVGAYCQIDYNVNNCGATGTCGGTNNLANTNGTGGTSNIGSNGGVGSAGLPPPCTVAIGSNSQYCSVPVPSLSSTTGAPNTTACQSLAGTDINTDLQQNVTGSGPNGNTNYNPIGYATPDKAQQLANCLGGSVVLTSVQATGSTFGIPPTLQIIVNGVNLGDAGSLINQLVVAHGGRVDEWRNSYVNIALANNGTGGNNGGTGTSGNQVGGSKSLDVSSTSGIGGGTSTQTTADQYTAAIKAQVTAQQANYLNQISQIAKAIGSAYPCGGSTFCPDLQALINLETSLYQAGTGYIKPIFTTNATGIMHVGDTWNVTVTGLTPGEKIYATGGRKTNGVVATDKTPYTANNLGVFFQTGTHAADVVGDWQIAWTRADGTALGTMIFSVVANATGAINPSGSGVLALSTNSNSYCVYSKGEHVNDTATYTVQGVTGNLANEKIVWSSTKNGVATGESNSYYGQTLNSNAFWSGNANAPWSVADIGSWTKTASAFNGTSIVSISQPFAFTVKDCSGATVIGTKTSNFSYSFVKVIDSSGKVTYKITLDNAALGIPSDFSYIPANASITAVSAQDLNTQAQNRYNTMSYFPGTPVGNTFYANIFGTFIAAYYDWNNQIAKAPVQTIPVATPDFTFTVVPTATPQNIARNPSGTMVSSISYTLTLTPINGFQGTINLLMISPLQGVTGGIATSDPNNPYLFNKNFIFDSAQAQSVSFIVAANPNTPTGLYNTIIVANAATTSRLPSHTVTLQTNVQ